ncbi:hypothetical protein [Boseongicola aestuarii]|jgi:hypothetical protein|uniref:TFIIB zinc-binding protein n=1 Tax=Boseongicola aestuarii TaxID=1470561 RepID=A0A238J5S6_9RHOB|nr:hypothetical protein [Boseongicola aestuarii]SMX25505.1 hypothetical protein BOA8489_03649 [Boseongicola aestuarii]
MPNTQKIATCCYCGSRAALVLRGTDRHELACASCGAPLHELKMLRSDAHGDRELVHPSAIRLSKKPSKQHRAPKSKPRKGKKSLKHRFKSSIWDIAEDVFEDVFDIFD